MSKTLFLFTGLMIATLLSIGNAAAQSIHLAPPIFPPLPQGQVLLKIVPAPGDSNHTLVVGSKIRIFGGKLWIISKKGISESIEVTGQTLQDIARTIKSDYPGAIAITGYPEYDGRFLNQRSPTLLNQGDTLKVKGGLGGPQIDATTSGVFGLNEIDEDEDGGKLLSNGGVQLDMVGQQALTRNTFLRFRMSFAGNDPQAVASQNDTTATMDATSGEDKRSVEDKVTTFIENAERFSMSVMLDWYWVNRSRTKVGFGLEYEAAWNALNDFDFPMVQINDTTFKKVDELFPEDRVSAVRREINNPRPASTVMGGLRLRFPAVSGLAIHGIFDIGFTERIRRKVKFDPTLDASLMSSHPESLEDDTDSNIVGIWRGGLGMTLGTRLDLRADAVGPLPFGLGDDFQPILRVTLSKTFPLKN